MGKVVEVVAAVVAIVAGVYMLTTQAAAANSIFNPLLHGIGLYFIARGLWMLRHAGREDDVVDRLEQLVELQAAGHVRATVPPAAAPPATAD